MLLAFDVGEIGAVLGVLAEQSFEIDMRAFNGPVAIQELDHFR